MNRPIGCKCVCIKLPESMLDLQWAAQASQGFVGGEKEQKMILGKKELYWILNKTVFVSLESIHHTFWGDMPSTGGSHQRHM
jgi:hypothetical protein